MQLTEPPIEESSLRLLLGEAQRPLVGFDRLGCSTQPSAQLPPCRVCQRIVRELTAGEYVVYEYQAILWTIPHGHGCRAVELDHRRWIRP